MENMDSTDKKLIEELQIDCSRGIKELSKCMGIPKSTVHNRIKRLEKEGVITGYRAVIDPEKLGMKSGAIILIKADFSQVVNGKKIKPEEVLEKLSNLRGVCEVHMITGEYDFILKFRGRNEREMRYLILDKIMGVQGIEGTLTCIILDTGEERNLVLSLSP